MKITKTNVTLLSCEHTMYYNKLSIKIIIRNTLPTENVPKQTNVKILYEIITKSHKN